jgi:hypothetical protein
MSGLIIDKEFQDLISPLTTEEFNQLETNILADGIREPIVCWENIIIDGHNRYKIAQNHGLEYKTIAKEFADRDEVIDWMINNQLGRRNLSQETQSYLRGLQYEREKVKEAFKGNQYSKSGGPQNDAYQNKGEHPTANKLAIQHNVSRATIERDATFSKAIDTITANTAPDIKHKMLNGEINITKNDAKQLAKLKPVEQKEIIEKSIEEKISVKQAMGGTMKAKAIIAINEEAIEPIAKVTSLLKDFMSYMENFEMNFSNAIVLIPDVRSAGIDFKTPLNAYHNVQLLIEGSIKLKKFVEKEGLQNAI